MKTLAIVATLGGLLALYAGSELITGAPTEQGTQAGLGLSLLGLVLVVLGSCGISRAIGGMTR